MKDTPRLKNIIKNDTGAFLCTWIPVVFAIAATSAFIYFESGKDNYSALEIAYTAPLVFFSLSICLWPFILWWWYSISTAFKNGIEIEAKNTNKTIRHAFDLSVIYAFEYQGVKIEHIASLIPNNTTTKISNMSSLSIVFNPENNISFLKNAYV